jgi:hypothetical protein
MEAGKFLSRFFLRLIPLIYQSLSDRFLPPPERAFPATLRLVMHLSLSGAKVIFTASFSL